MKIGLCQAPEFQTLLSILLTLKTPLEGRDVRHKAIQVGKDSFEPKDSSHTLWRILETEIRFLEEEGCQKWYCLQERGAGWRGLCERGAYFLYCYRSLTGGITE